MKIILLPLLLTGCTLFPTKEIYVPVVSCPAPVEVAYPNMNATPDLPDGEFAKALHADFIAIKGYANSLKQIVDQYKVLSEIKAELK